MVYQKSLQTSEQDCSKYAQLAEQSYQQQQLNNQQQQNYQQQNYQQQNFQQESYYQNETVSLQDAVNYLVENPAPELQQFYPQNNQLILEQPTIQPVQFFKMAYTE